MSKTVTIFESKHRRSAEGALSAFITFCKDELTTFGDDLRFEDDVWLVTGWVKVKATKSEVRLRFSNLRSSKQRNRMAPMAEPFRSFAKSYVRYQHSLKARANYSHTLTALRVLEAALFDQTGTSDPSNLCPDVLNRAAELLKASMSPGTAYSCGKELQAINRLSISRGLVNVLALWKNTIPPKLHRNIRVGQEFDKFRMTKMPSPEAFYALADIFRNGPDPEDVLVSSCCAILCSAPSRISEVVLLPSACEVIQTDVSNAAKAYGLSWLPSKRGKPMIKYIATPMVDVVKEAIQRLRTMSIPACQLARWYERSPRKLYLPAELEYLRAVDELSLMELDRIVFVDGGKKSDSRAWQWAQRMSLATVKRKGANYVQFREVEARILDMLPPDFPYLERSRNLKYSDALMLVCKHELDTSKGTYRCMFQPVEPNDINTRIGKRPTLSIFAKYGLTEADGLPLALSTHKFRHYLNTLAQTNNMDQLDLARWSGRQRVTQNVAYDHVSDEDVIEKLRLAFQGTATAVGSLAKLHKVSLVSREEFGRLRVGTAHTTSLGHCVHDFSMLPCQMHQDCINCGEQICIKGHDSKQESNIRAMREETAALLARAQEALGEAESGADRWVAHHKITLARLEQLCSILNDPNVPIGAVIRLEDGTTHSSIQRALDRRPLVDVAVALPSLPVQAS